MRKLAVPLVLLLIAAVVLFVTRDQEDELAFPAPSESPSRPEDSAALVFRTGLDLKVMDIATGDVETVATVPGPDTTVSLDGTKWAGTRGVPKPGDPEADPTAILVGDMEGTEPAVVGPGYSPVWSLDGSQIAALVPADGYLICEQGADLDKAQDDPSSQGCFEAERVHYYDTSDESSVIAVGAGSWRIVGWTVESQVVAASRHNNVTRAGIGNATDEGQPRLPFASVSVQGVSPSTAQVLVQAEGQVNVLRLDGTPDAKLDISTPIGEVAWAPDGQHILVEDSQHRLIMVDAPGKIRSLDRTLTGAVVWSMDSERFAFVDGATVEVCVTATLDCEASSIPAGAELLALR